MLRYLAFCLVTSLLIFGFSHAQTPVYTYPQQIWGCNGSGGTPTSCPANASGTIAVTNTFQTVFTQWSAPSTPRRACTIQNNGTGTMWVFVGPKALATKAKSFQLGPPANGQPGGALYCQTQNGSTVQDEISITGTAADAFAAIQE